MVENDVRPGTTSDGTPQLYGFRNRYLGYLRVLFSYAGAIVILILAEPTPLLFLLGLPFIIAGEWFHTWAHGHLIKTSTVITSGPYAHTQNPLYLGRILMVTGFLITAKLPFGANWLILIICCMLFFGYYMPRKTRVEGRRLRTLHGQTWERYNRAVPVLFPSTKPYADTSGNRFSFSRMMANREYGMHAGILVALIWLGYKAFQGSGI